MEEYDLKLTKADIWLLLGAMNVSESECVCFTDVTFMELEPYADWHNLRIKLEKILYKEYDGTL